MSSENESVSYKDLRKYFRVWEGVLRLNNAKYEGCRTWRIWMVIGKLFKVHKRTKSALDFFLLLCHYSIRTPEVQSTNTCQLSDDKLLS